MYKKDMPRDKHIELLRTVATKSAWTNIHDLHKASLIYKTASGTSQALNTLMCFGMVEGTRSRGADNFKISSLGRSVLIAPPERQVRFFRKKYGTVEPVSKICESCGKLAPLFLWKKKHICEDCLNPDYAPTYTGRVASPLGFDM